MITLIPMAGEGQRFKDENYAAPKPLIDISGKPMVVRAVECNPPAEKLVFVCRKNHIFQHGLDRELKKYFKSIEIIVIENPTEGQASTCLLAKKSIPQEDELFIGACDNGMIYNVKKFEELKKTFDALIFTFRNNPTVIEKPHHYGWVSVEENFKARSISVKKPISSNPVRDHAIVGAFWFKKGKIFVEGAENMIRKNKRINNEFYVDESFNELIERGYSVGVMEIDFYIGWGTPKDLKAYLYWRNFFLLTKLHLNPI